METNHQINAINITLKMNEENSITENKNIQENYFIKKILNLSDINPEDLKAKINLFFNEKLNEMELKYKKDLKDIIKPLKYEFIGFSQEIEFIKMEILQLNKNEEEKVEVKNTNLKVKGISLNETSRSKTPFKPYIPITTISSAAKDVRNPQINNHIQYTHSNYNQTQYTLCNNNYNNNINQSKFDSFSKSLKKKN